MADYFAITNARKEWYQNAWVKWRFDIELPEENDIKMPQKI